MMTEKELQEIERELPPPGSQINGSEGLVDYSFARVTVGQIRALIAEVRRLQSIIEHGAWSKHGPIDAVRLDGCELRLLDKQ